MAQGEPKWKQAADWILTEWEIRPNASKPKLIDEASLKFNLTPNDQEYLQRNLKKPTKA